MYKVKCKVCGNIGYTAAPHQVKCSECGGDHRIINTRMAEEPGFKTENAYLKFLKGCIPDERRVI